ncbi:MAG: hypothetical protein WCI81_03930 [Chlorobiaceae bacterium]
MLDIVVPLSCVIVPIPLIPMFAMIMVRPAVPQINANTNIDFRLGINRGATEKHPCNT